MPKQRHIRFLNMENAGSLQWEVATQVAQRFMQDLKKEDRPFGAGNQLSWTVNRPDGAKSRVVTWHTKTQVCVYWQEVYFESYREDR